ncbi:MAG: PASTA domain-containing protein [Candidatus Aminicenantaceae bacterium]
MKQNKTFKIIFYVLIILNTFFIGAIIAFYIVQKGETISVPDLTGRSLEEARYELILRKLSIIKSGVQYNNKWKQDKIISQEPPPGSIVKANSIVKVILSAGSESIRIPNLIGKNLQNINKILADNDLRRKTIAQIHTKKYAAGKVITQLPEPYKEVPENAAISLLISQGEYEPRYVMPDLIGRRANPVMEELEKMGFKIGDLRYSYYEGLEKNIIIRQSPHQGYCVQKRNLITLEVSK